jgi:nicotinate phosphoribosyltransferase
LSENINKITLPDRKQVFRITDDEDNFIGADAVTLENEEDVEIMYHPLYPLKWLSVGNYIKEPLLHKVMENGMRLHNPKTLVQIAHYNRDRMAKLPEEYKRFDNPHIYKVGISKGLQTERDSLIDSYKK